MTEVAGTFDLYGEELLELVRVLLAQAGSGHDVAHEDEEQGVTAPSDAPQGRRVGAFRSLATVQGTPAGSALRTRK